MKSILNKSYHHSQKPCDAPLSFADVDASLISFQLKVNMRFSFFSPPHYEI